MSDMVRDAVAGDTAIVSIDLASKIEYHPTRLLFLKRLSTAEWQYLGRMLRMMEGAIQWWVGDWALYGENTYGSGYAQHIEATGYSYDAITNQVWVASRFPFSRRRENLSWSHHEAVAGKDVEQQERLLNWAEAPNREGKTARNVHALRNKANGKFEYKELLTYDTPGGLRITISRRKTED